MKEDPCRCPASESRDDWEEDSVETCDLCGCTQPNPECRECRDGTDDPVDHRDPYKEWIERQLVEDHDDS